VGQEVNYVWGTYYHHCRSGSISLSFLLRHRHLRLDASKLIGTTVIWKISKIREMSLM